MEPGGVRARLNLLEERLRGEMAGGRGGRKEVDSQRGIKVQEVESRKDRQEVEKKSGLKEEDVEVRKKGQDAPLLCPGEKGGKYVR